MDRGFKNVMKIGFIGFGKLGQPCGEVIASKGHDVVAYDVREVDTKVEMRPTIQETVEDREIVFVAVPTPHDPAYDVREPTSHLPPKDFDYEIVKQVLSEADKHMNKNQLLVLISTVLPGTVRREFIHLINNPKFVYNPYLIAMGTVGWDMINPEMVMIGTEDGETSPEAGFLKSFYESIMENNPRYVIGTWDECECIKVFYNTFISAKIGLVNMIQDVAEKQGNINVDVVATALRDSTRRIMGPSYMKPGMGDGGACHPRDNIALRYMAEKLHLGYDLFASIMEARDKQALNMAMTILSFGRKVFFTSDSYKPHVEYVEGSYSLLVQNSILQLGGKIMNDIHLAEVAVKVHQIDEIDPDFDGIVFDPWRTHKGINTVSYGDTRGLK
jgi:UDPglucose 6-dehydrogenase